MHGPQLGRAGRRCRLIGSQRRQPGPCDGARAFLARFSGPSLTMRLGYVSLTFFFLAWMMLLDDVVGMLCVFPQCRLPFRASKSVWLRPARPRPWTFDLRGHTPSKP